MSLTACTFTQHDLSTATSTELPLIPTPTKVYSSEDWTTEWLEGIPCHPPCWENITPGQTIAEDAVATLKSNPLVSTAVLTTSPWPNDGGYVLWNWANGYKGGEARFQDQNPTRTIYHIHPYLRNPISFGAIMKSYGDPNFIVASMANNYEGNTTIFDLKIIYLSRGFVLSEGGSGRTSLSADTTFDEIDLFTPTKEGLYSVFPNLANHPELLVPWQGIKDFEYYCRDDVGGKVCHASQ